MTAFAGTTVITTPAVACQFAPDTPDAVISAASGFNLCEVRDGALLVTPVMV